MSPLNKAYYFIDEAGNAKAFGLEDTDVIEGFKDRPDYYKYFVSEEMKNAAHQTPPHISALTKLQLASLEPASDVGNYRYYPFGAMIKGLLEDYIRDVVLREFGAYEIVTPILYDYSLPDIHEQAKEFRQKDYHLRVGNRTFLLRFASDFGLFRMMKDASIREDALPVRMYEISNSFRLERRSECVGMRRLRSFTMPDVHSFCKDHEQGKEEFRYLTKKYHELLSNLGLPYALVARVTKPFEKEGIEFMSSIASELKRPVIAEVIPAMKYYWEIKDEFQFIDSTGNNLQLSTVQLDVKNSERYGLTYAKRDGTRGNYVIVHSSLGAIERLFSSMIEQAFKSNKLPMLPLWLSPIQVRVIPVSQENYDRATEVAVKLREKGFRAYVDDSESSFNKKIREAATHWTPYTIVIGKKEQEQNVLSVTIRSLSSLERAFVKTMKLEDLISALEEESRGFPKRQAEGPVRLSLVPKF
ncbi:aminoacyl--tRNA ligase-related protein [Tardisphaera saccharovorans]|nr:aminoacyl--tRNA ligase-related protein [TACK group archaeon]